jgi:hypothetical protein
VLPINAAWIALAFAAVFLVLLWLKLRSSLTSLTQEQSRRKIATAARDQAIAEAQRLSEVNATLTLDAARLARWQLVEDADATAKAILLDAKTKADRLTSDADKLRSGALSDAVGRATALRTEAENKANAILIEAHRIRETAAAEVRSLLAKAEQDADVISAAAKALEISAKRGAETLRAKAEADAQQVAGDALRALRTADGLEAAISALENRISGYGDRYLVPPQSLLDDLAESLAYTDAGVGYRNARRKVKQMILTSSTATCEYVERERRETAIRFVTDAFNGRAESIVARSRSENFGVLARELRDAFSLVNLHGKAFRGARILDSFLDARVAELKWACAVQEMKQRERDEQRRAKQILREEELVRRECEKELREASRDEERLREAVRKIQDDLKNATEAQRESYEATIAELQERVALAEARGQRAISMAQQTKRGHVYVVSNIGSFGENVFKIGLTRRLEPYERIRELGDSSVPFEFDVHALLWSDDAPALEAKLHRHFVLNQVNKVNRRKEFFRASLGEIRAQIDGLGLNASWTMAATALEYRETRVLEAQLQNDAESRERWVASQLSLLDYSEPIPTLAADRVE